MTVSIITPAWNAAAHLEATARTVLAQTYADWEWIVVDDGSTDATREIVARIGDPRVRLLSIAHSGLPAVARNRGVEAARGAFIAYLDADDLWLPDKLATQLALFDAHPRAGLVFSKVRYLFEEVGRLARRAEPSMEGIANPGLLFPHLAMTNLIAASSVVLRRELLDAHGLMDEDPRQRGTEDYELWLRLAPHAPFAWSDRPLVHYRVDPRSLSGKAVANAHGRILAVEKAIARGTPLPPQLEGRKLEAAKLAWLGHAQLRDGVERNGRAALREALRIDGENALARRWLPVSYLPAAVTRALRRVAYRFV